MEVKVHGKRIDGWIFKQAKLSVEVIDATHGTGYVDIPVKMALYCAAKEGSVWTFNFEEREDGLWMLVRVGADRGWLRRSSLARL